MSLYAFVFAGVTPIGSFFVGSISELYGVSTAYALGGGLALLCIGLLTLWYRRARIRGSAAAA